MARYAAQISFSPPPDVPPHLVVGIEAAAVDETFGQAQRHRRVVGPLTRREPERTTADHVVDWRSTALRGELERRAESIANREADETSDMAISLGHRHISK